MHCRLAMDAHDRQNLGACLRDEDDDGIDGSLKLSAAVTAYLRFFLDILGAVRAFLERFILH